MATHFMHCLVSLAAPILFVGDDSAAPTPTQTFWSHCLPCSESTYQSRRAEAPQGEKEGGNIKFTTNANSFISYLENADLQWIKTAIP